MWATPDDLCPTETSMEQRSTEEAIAPLVGNAAAPPPALHGEEHAAFLRRILEPLPSPYVAFDANRAWLIYWVAHSLDLLGTPLRGAMRVRAISTLLHMQHAAGGFGGGPSQIGHLMSTYAAVNALAILGGPGDGPHGADADAETGSAATRGGWDAIDRPALYAWMMRLKQPDGSFLVHEHGEIDVRATYCVIVVASLLGLVSDELLEGVGPFVASCQTYEGGFASLSCAQYATDGARVVARNVAAHPPQGEAHGGYSFCALASHTQLLALGRAAPIRTHALVRWATALQGLPVEGGGFRGRTNKLVDGCYGWFCGGGLMTLLECVVGARPAAAPPSPASTDSWATIGDAGVYLDPLADRADDDLYDRAALARYILAVAQAPRGGLRDKPGKRPDAYHTCYNLSGLSLSERRVRRSPARAAHFAAQLGGSGVRVQCYAESLAWESSEPAVACARTSVATHPVFNIALAHAERAMTYFYGG
ncbi:protein farnesyltransferase [Malassezia sp. CBS 17886]|nr:protein farnesyltransferase [Malassezia sp. CBS 17886]